jgi:hypothetical protein
LKEPSFDLFGVGFCLALVRSGFTWIAAKGKAENGEHPAIERREDTVIS